VKDGEYGDPIPTITDDNDSPNAPNASALPSAPPAAAASTTDQPSNRTTAIVAQRKKGGRPKGTSDKAKQVTRTKIVQATDFVTKQYAEIKKKANGAYAPAGTLKRLVEAATQKYDIPPSVQFTVKPSTLHSRLMTGRHSVPHPGTVSPLAGIEVLVIEILKYRWRMYQPLTPKEVKSLINSMIAGSRFERAFKRFKEQRTNVDPSEPLVGNRWLRNFIKRNKMYIKLKKKRKHAQTRAKDALYEHLQQMYDNNYAMFVEAGIAVELAEPVHMDRDGNIVDDESKAFGYPVTHVYTHPHLAFFGDECGDNTNMKKDCLFGGEKAFCPEGTDPRIIAGVKNSHFTVICFTNAAKKPVLCCIIFAAHKLELLWKSGFDVFAPWADGDQDIHNEANHGKGKKFPFGPECVWGGKRIPCFCDATPNGSMTSTILMRIFEYMDELEIIPRVPGGPSPCVVMDGHGSRLDDIFLDYVLNENHRWYIGLGAPNATDIWQVGDSSEQNGTYKMYLSRGKEELIRKKTAAGLPPEIDKTDIVGLVSYAFEPSFGNETNNGRAMCQRGWQPLNRACLDDPHVLATASEEVKAERKRVLESRGISVAFLETTNESTTINQADLNELNVTEGNAGNIIGMMFDHHEKTGGKEQHEQRKKDKSRYIDDINRVKRLTAGAYVLTGENQLTANFNELVKQRKAKKAGAAKAVQDRKLQRLKKLKKEVDAIKRKYPGKLNTKDDIVKAKVTVAEVKKLVSWKKDAKDDSIPSKKEELIERYLATKHRPDHDVPPDCSYDANIDMLDSDDEEDLQDDAHKSDEEGDEEGDGDGDESEEEDDYESDLEDEENDVSDTNTTPQTGERRSLRQRKPRRFD
jgi:hypothetical protein